MTPTLVMVHTIPVLVDAFTGWSRDEIPSCRVLHVLDEPLLVRIKQRGHVGPDDDDRLLAHTHAAEAVGAAAVLVTCSSISESVVRVRDRAGIPVIAADDAMAGEAVRLGPRVSIVATSATTLEPSSSRVQAAAEQAGRQVEIQTRLVDGALEALLAGDTETHDRLVLRGVTAAAADADVIVLAQATMARVLPVLAVAPPRVPVLASPQLALAEVRRVILPNTADAVSDQHEV
jgi:Asp/Glu/hydantoin racemase